MKPCTEASSSPPPFAISSSASIFSLHLVSSLSHLSLVSDSSPSPVSSVQMTVCVCVLLSVRLYILLSKCWDFPPWTCSLISAAFLYHRSCFKPALRYKLRSQTWAKAPLFLCWSSVTPAIAEMPPCSQTWGKTGSHFQQRCLSARDNAISCVFASQVRRRPLFISDFLLVFLHLSGHLSYLWVLSHTLLLVHLNWTPVCFSTAITLGCGTKQQVRDLPSLGPLPSELQHSSKAIQLDCGK